MPPEFAGWLYILGAGIFQGSFMLPMKLTKQWAWENTWLIFSTTAYLICPWLFVLFSVPQAGAIYASVPVTRIALVMCMGLLWGLGAITFGLGVDAVGMSIGFAVIIGVTACSGTLAPLLFLGDRPRPAILIATVLALLIVLAGVGLCSYAGRWKEAAMPEKASYRTGIAICIASGLLSSAGNLGFVLGQPIIEEAKRHGAAASFAPNVVWSLLTVALFICNATFASIRLARNGTFTNFRLHTAANLSGGIAMGALWMLGFAFYGAGTTRLGKLGPAFGWSAMMCLVVVVANILGTATGEWRSAPAASVRTLWSGIGLLFLALIALGACTAFA